MKHCLLHLKQIKYEVKQRFFMMKHRLLHLKQEVFDIKHYLF